MKVAFVSEADPDDVRHWSGIPYHMLRALKRTIPDDVVSVYPLHMKIKLSYKLKWHFYNRVVNRAYWWNMEPQLLRDLSEQAARRLAADSSVELVFGPFTNATPLAYLDCKIPMIFWADATFQLLLDTYPFGSGPLCRENIRHFETNQRALLDRCALAVYASSWAAESAIADYGMDRDRVAVIPFGANLESALTRQEVEQAVLSRDLNLCHLLFVGVDWERKGGDLCLEVTRLLNEQGLHTRLTIVGCRPPVASDPNVEIIGFIDKGSKQGSDLLSQLFMRSHFFIMPSRAEAFGIVFAEANSFGVPCVSRRVGGISSSISDGVNGRLFDAQAPAEEYCRYITQMWSDRQAYRSLCLSAFDEYRSRLNWETGMRRLLEKARTVLEGKSA